VASIAALTASTGVGSWRATVRRTTGHSRCIS